MLCLNLSGTACANMPCCSWSQKLCPLVPCNLLIGSYWITWYTWQILADCIGADWDARLRLALRLFLGEEPYTVKWDLEECVDFNGFHGSCNLGDDRHIAQVDTVVQLLEFLHICVLQCEHQLQFPGFKSRLESQTASEASHEQSEGMTASACRLGCRSCSSEGWSTWPSGPIWLFVTMSVKSWQGFENTDMRSWIGVICCSFWFVAGNCASCFTRHFIKTYYMRPCSVYMAKIKY